MSIVQIGSFLQDSGSSVTSVSFPVTTAMPTGQMAIAVQAHGGTAGKTFTATDTKGNTWTSRFVNEDNTTNNRLCILTAPVTVALTTSDTITVTVSQSRATWCIIAFGSTDATAIDVSNIINTSGSSSSPSTGATATAAQASQYVVGAFAWSSAATFSPGSGYTALAEVDANTAARHISVEYMSVSTLAARVADATLSGTTAWAAGLVAFNYTAAAPSTGWFIRAAGGSTWTNAEAIIR